MTPLFMILVKPTHLHLQSYLRALESDWHDLPKGSSPESVKNKIRDIQGDPNGFFTLFDDPQAKALPYLLPDQTVAYAVPSIRRWIWDDVGEQYCGTVSLRWQKGTTELPPHLMGHIGYTVVPWMQKKGYGSFALQEILKIASIQGLSAVQLVTDVSNVASNRVIEKNGGTLIQTFTKPKMYGAGLANRYLINTFNSSKL